MVRVAVLKVTSSGTGPLVTSNSRYGISAGADVALMDDAWWGPSIPLPGGPWFCLAERTLPG